MDEIEIPKYFLCPISLQIMKDPVTTVTGITYDRESIDQWLITAVAEETAPVCPVTKQPLPRGSDLTPNHMLRRLIQGWCFTNAKNGVERFPTPKSAVHRSIVLKLVRQVNNTTTNTTNDCNLRFYTLKKIVEIARESEDNRKTMVEAGVPKAMVLFIMREVSKKGPMFTCLEQAMTILHLTWSTNNANTEYRQLVETNVDFVESILWILRNHTKTENNVNTPTLLVLKNVMEVAKSSLLESLNLDFFKEMVNILRINSKESDRKATGLALSILIQACPLARNRVRIVEVGAVHELIEIELSDPAEKKVSELVFCLLANLCCCAEGRQEFLKHAGGVAMVAKRLLRISPAADDRAMCIIEAIARFAATREVVMEMLRVSAVAKLCMVIQADCADYLKKKAMEVLRMHSDVWSGSPCIQVYLLTRYNR